MQKMHNLAARLVADPVPGPRPVDAWAVVRVPHHLGRPPVSLVRDPGPGGRGPRALDLVPGGRDPAGPVALGRATWCALSVPGDIIR
jgi:hypothetical protein